MFPPSKSWFSAFYSLYFYRLVPWIGGLLAHDHSAYRYLAESVESFYSPQTVAEMLEQAGFKRVSLRKFLNGAVCMHVAEKFSALLIRPNVLRSFFRSFLVFFYQVALGGLFGLSATPFHELERAFYKSTAGVLFVIAALGSWGKSRLYWQNIFVENNFANVGEILFHVLFVISFASYMVSLWSENQGFRARSFTSCLLCGTAGLLFSAHSFYQAPFWSFETFVYPVAFFLSSLLLGTVTVG